MNRVQLLRNLIEYNSSLKVIQEKLASFKWDSSELITLTKEHIISVLNRYIEGSISAEELEDWADTIECREDIHYNDHDDDIINEKIYILANPVLQGKMDKARALSMINELSS